MCYNIIMSTLPEGVSDLPQSPITLADVLATSQALSEKLCEANELQVLLSQQIGALAASQTIEVAPDESASSTHMQQQSSSPVLRPYSRAEANSAIEQEKYNQSSEFTDHITDKLLPYTQAILYEADERRPRPLGKQIGTRAVKKLKGESHSVWQQSVDWNEEEGPVDHRFSLTYTQSGPDTPPALERYTVRHVIMGTENPASLSVSLYFDKGTPTQMSLSWQAKVFSNEPGGPAQDIQLLCPDNTKDTFDLLRSMRNPSRGSQSLVPNWCNVRVGLPASAPQHSDLTLSMESYLGFPYDSQPEFSQRFAYDLAQNQLACAQYNGKSRPQPQSHEDYLQWLDFGLQISGLIS